MMQGIFTESPSGSSLTTEKCRPLKLSPDLQLRVALKFSGNALVLLSGRFAFFSVLLRGILNSTLLWLIIVIDSRSLLSTRLGFHLRRLGSYCKVLHLKAQLEQAQQHESFVPYGWFLPGYCQQSYQS